MSVLDMDREALAKTLPGRYFLILIIHWYPHGAPADEKIIKLFEKNSCSGYEDHVGIQ